LNSIFEVQSEVAQNVANSLRAQVLPEVKLIIEEIPTTNTLAYEQYLKGIEQLNMMWGNEDISHVDEAIKYFEQAIELDPDFSDAYTGMGNAYWRLAHWSPEYDPEYWELSRKNLLKAIELDLTDGTAYAEMGVIQHNWDWNKQAARNSLQKALELSPSDAWVHNHIRYFYLRIGNCQEAEKAARMHHSLRNLDYDPQQDFLLLVCRKDLEQISRLNPDGDLRLLMFQGKYQQVIDQITSMDTISNPVLQVALGEALALNGDSLGALRIIERMEQASRSNYVPSIAFAPIYMALGNEDMAYAKLEQALEEREYRLHFMQNMTISMYRAQDDPRFKSIVGRSWIPQD
jgi:tetratricopeptide (TPR) repeat protein